MIGFTSNYLAACAASRSGGRPIWRLEIDGYSRVLVNRSDALDLGASPWIVSLDTIQQSVDVLEGGSTLGDVSLVVLDRQRLFTADLAGIVLEGRVAQLKAGYPGLALADYAVLFTGLVNAVTTSEDACSYGISIVDMARVAQQVIYTEGDDGAPTDSDHPKRVVGNPLDILLSILRDYVGLADHDIDIAKIEACRDELFGGMEFEFYITSPPEAQNFIEQEILKPLGGFGYTNNLGQYTVDFMQPLSGSVASAMTLDANVLTVIPAIDQSDLINTVSYRFDSNQDDKFMAETVQVYGSSVTTFGTQGQTVIESKGVKSGFGGFALAATVARAIFSRFGTKNPKLTCTCLWGAHALSVAQFILLTHAKIPNRVSGGMGVNQLFQIVSKTMNLTDRTVELEVVDATKLQLYGSKKIAPDAIANWTLASGAQKARYLFVGGADGKQSDGTDNGTLA